MRRWLCDSTVGDVPRVAGREVLRHGEGDIESESFNEIRVACDHHDWLKHLFELRNSMFCGWLSLGFEFFLLLGSIE